MSRTRYLKFNTKKGYLIPALTFHTAALCLLPIFLGDDPLLLTIFAPLATSLVLITTGLYLRSYYLIDLEKDELLIYFLFKAKRVDLKDIRDVVRRDSPSSGVRYSLSSQDGLLLRISRYDEIFINPKDSEEFCRALADWRTSNANSDGNK